MSRLDDNEVARDATSQPGDVARHAVAWRSSARELGRSRVVTLALGALFASLFVLLPLHEVFYHFVLKNRIGAAGVLLFPEHVLIVLLVVLVWRRVGSAARFWRRELLWVAGYSVAYWVSCLANPVSMGYAVQVFFCGVVFPLLFLLLVHVGVYDFGFHPVRQGLVCLLAGLGAVCVAGVVAYPISFGIPESFYEFMYIFRTWRALAGAGAGVWYGDVTLGNFNVFAGCMLPAIWLGCAWYLVAGVEGKFSRFGAALLAVLVGVNFYVCYSRGAILVLNFTAAVFCLLARRKVRPRALGWLIAGVLMFDALAIAPKGAVSYWLHSFEKSPTNSVEQRLELWEGVIPGFRPGAGAESEAIRRGLGDDKARSFRWWSVAFGVGIGRYGVWRGLGPDSNTHNLFLNQYVALGAGGAVAFVGMFAVVMWRGFKTIVRRADANVPIRLGAFVGVMAIGLVGIVTQYEFSNLGTMTGAALFWTCAFFSRWGATDVYPRVRPGEW